MAAPYRANALPSSDRLMIFPRPSGVILGEDGKRNRGD
jgi:hypothetical protein